MRVGTLATLLLSLLFQPAPPLQLAALGPPEPCQAGEMCAVWVVVFGEGPVRMSTTAPAVMELVVVEDRTPTGMVGMRWLRYTYRAPAGVYTLDYTACGASGVCASARALVRVGWQVYLPLIRTREGQRWNVALPLVRR